MSDINCSACSELKQYAPDFAANGVTEAVCTSLHDNDGFNPDNDHENEEDLHNANDCLIGNLVDTVEAYEVCDWKDFMKKFGDNLYEVLKAIICSQGGIQGLADALCEQGDMMLNLIQGTMTPVPADTVTNKMTFAAKPQFLYRITNAQGCNEGTKSYMAWSWYVPGNVTTVNTALAKGDELARWNKATLVNAIGEHAYNVLNGGGEYSSIGFWISGDTIIGCIFIIDDDYCRLLVEAICGTTLTGNTVTFHPSRLYVKL